MPRPGVRTADSDRGSRSRSRSRSPASKAAPETELQFRNDATPRASPVCGTALGAEASRVQRLLGAEDARERLRGARERLERQQRVEAQRATCAAQGDPCPEHAPIDTFNAVVEAIFTATETENPGFNFTSDPLVVFKWTLQQLQRLEAECFAAGRAEAERESHRPLPPAVADRILDTCEALQEALQMAQPAARRA